MEQNQQNVFNEADRLTDLLCWQKYIAGVYNTYYSEAVTPSLVSAFSSILEDEHRIQSEIFGELTSRGFYVPEKAEDQKVADGRQKFSQSAKV